MVENEIEFQDIKFADVVFKGEVTDYEKIIRDPETGARYALVAFKVLETLRGEERTHWELVWENSTYELPGKWELSNPIYVAGLWATKPNQTPEETWDTGISDVRPDLLHVLQAACSKPFFLADTKEMREQLKHALQQVSPQKDK